ncbi:MAG: hypothetical protein U1F66_04420 [bacterium]
MTPPCANCHGAPRTAELPSSASSATPCPAEPRWPEWLRQDHPELQALDSWVRGNFENAREHPLPLRIEVGRGSLDAELRLRAGTRSFAPFPWSGSPYRALAVELSPGARATSHWEIRANALPLGLRTLLNLEGVYLDGPATLNFWPERISVGNFGELHAISGSTASALFLFDPFMVPRPPVGRDFPTEDQWQEVQDCLAQATPMDGGQECYPAVTYPNHRDNPRFDFRLTDFIPAELLDPNRRLPRHYDLETLLGRWLEYRRAHPSRGPADPRGPQTRARALLESVAEWLEPGSRVELDLEQLNDLFLPGLLDVGPSRGRFELVYQGGGLVTLEGSELEINLDPTDLPSRPGPTRPGVRLETANLSSRVDPAELDGIDTPPGLRVAYDAASGQLWMEANLSLTAQATLPLLGAVELEGQLLLRSAWRLTDAGLEPIPESTALEFRRGELWEAGGRRPLLTGFNLSLSDRPEVPEGLEWAFRGSSAEPRAAFALSGWLGRERRLELRGEVPLPLRLEDGGYDLAALLQNLSAQLAVQLNGPHSYTADIAVRSAETAGARGRTLEIDFDLQEGVAGAEARRSLLRGGHLAFRAEREAEGHDHYFAEFRAAAIDRGPIALRGVEGELAVDRWQVQDGVLELRVPTLSLRLNPHGAPRGILRGPVSLDLGGSAGLSILWNGPEHHLAVDGLDLRFSAAGLRVLPPSLLRILDPRVVGLGLDGHFEGAFTAELPEDRRRWRARGDLRLRGDREGDIYLLDGAGRRVGLPLVRDTRWRWRRVDRIDWRRRYALGDFHLDTLLNFSALLPASRIPASEEAGAYGARGQRLFPYEINGIMPYDNQPWDPRGFQNRIVDYLMTLCRQNPACREGLEGGTAP